MEAAAPLVARPGKRILSLRLKVFTLCIGHACSTLAAVRKRLRISSSFYVTAHNPFIAGSDALSGALFGPELMGVNKSVSVLLKRLHLSSDDQASEEDLEWAVRMALEACRRVKDQQ